MNILIIPASLRKDSFNKKLARLIHEQVSADSRFKSTLIDLRDYPMPSYDGDLETSEGVDKNASKLAELISKADAIIIATPEYNGGMPGFFKNVIDWTSRMRPIPWAHKPVLLTGASPGGLGAIRSLWHSRQPLEALTCHVYPEMFGLSSAQAAFDAQGKLVEEKNQQRLKKLVDDFLNYLSV